MRIYIEKYRKQILATVMIILMIAFILPSAYKGPGGGRINRVVGHIGKEAVHSNDLLSCEQSWDLLNKTIAIPTGVPGRYLKGTVLMLPRSGAQPEAVGVVSDLIQTHPEAFYLLVKEAERNGVVVTADEVSRMLEEAVAVAGLGTQAPVAYNDMDNPNLADAIRVAVGQAMLVQKSLEKAEGAVTKVSRPMRRQVLAQESDTATFDLVEIPAAPFLPTVQAPTTQQVEAHFKQYASADPNDEVNNPEGFGYRYPNRVKLQYIEVPLADVRAAAERKRNADEKTQYEWDRDAFKYYQEHPDRFSTKQPDPNESMLAVNPKAPASKPATTQGPATRPFAEAKADARRFVLDADVAKLATRVQERVVAQMNGDFVAYRNGVAQAGGDASKAPASSVGVPYNTFEYLQKLAADTQKQFGVLPVIRSFDNAFLTPQEFIGLAGVGQLRLETGEPLYQYVFTNGQAFAPPTKDETRVLKPFEPTPALHDAENNAYVVRLTDMQKAHVPASLAEVQAAVEHDLRAAAALKAAKAEASKLLAAAKQAGSLKAAADAAGRKVVTAANVSFLGLARADAVYSPPPLQLPNRIVQRTFLREAFDLFATVTPPAPKPLGLIEVPRDGKVYVAQVTDGRPTATEPNDLLTLRSLLLAEIDRAGEYRSVVWSKWFDYDDLVARMDYKAEAPPADEERAPGPAKGDTPANRPLL